MSSLCLLLTKDPNFQYIPPSMRCQNIIDHTSIEFHDYSYPPPVTLFEDAEVEVDAEYQFGILKLNIRGEIPIIKKHVHIIFQIDCSASMSDRCRDGRTKMHHILHTLENMLYLFYEKPGTDVSIHIQTFNTTVVDVVTNVPNIKKANIEEIVQKVQSIRPNGSTNIELALQSSATHIESYKQNSIHKNEDIIHIFLTDGEITVGETNSDILKSLVIDSENITNIFIGYGLEHDSRLLSLLGNGVKNEYRFIDALEKAGLVYGEIVHGILFKAIEDVSIIAENAELYDFETNLWFTTLEVGNLLSEQKKIFHIRTKTKNETNVKVFGRTIVQTRPFENLTGKKELQVEVTIGKTSDENLTQYIFRQRTQELLYKARKLSEKKIEKIIENPIKSYNNWDNNLYNKLDNNLYNKLDKDKEKEKVKKELKSFFDLLVQYTKTNNLENDAFIKMLCDDIYITYKILGTNYANMFTCSRQITQGRQYIYTCSPFEHIDQDNLRYNFNNINGDCDCDDDELNYPVSSNVLSPYSSDGAVETMREISINHNLNATVDFNNLTCRTQYNHTEF